MQANEPLADSRLIALARVDGYPILRPVALLKKIGEGGMGVVYQGRHLRLDIDVAVKVMVTPAGLEPAEAEGHARASSARHARRRRSIIPIWFACTTSMNKTACTT